MDTAITIRTIFMTNDRAYVQAGAGIVADSVPEREYLETVSKAKALVRALEIVGRTREPLIKTGVPT
jgi:anthranilate synthase component 1